MSALARYFHASGKKVSGYDKTSTKLTQALMNEGIDIVFQHWRGIMGPPNMSKEEIEFWDHVFGEMVKTEAWKKTLEHFMWEDFYKDSEETYKYLEEQSMMYEQLMGVH